MSCVIQTGYIKDLLVMKGNDDAKTQFSNLVKCVKELEAELARSKEKLCAAEAALSAYKAGVEVEGTVLYDKDGTNYITELHNKFYSMRGKRVSVLVRARDEV